jgi:hypothetical protein
MADRNEKSTTPRPPHNEPSVRYGREESVGAAIPGGKDEFDRTGQPPSREGADRPDGSRAVDAFTSSEVQDRTAEKGLDTAKTSS